MVTLEISEFESHTSDENYALSSWDTDRANEWLKNNYISPTERTSLNNIHQHFKTARALICIEETELALLLLAKIRRLAYLHNRTLDVIEAEILIAIAYNMNKNIEQALGVMTSALINAQSYGCTILFENEARGIYSILNELSFNITRYGDTSGIDTDFLRNLCVLTGKKLSKNFIYNLYEKKSSMKLTNKQISAGQMLAKGYSYREIAENMGVTHSTAKSYLRELYNKLGVFNVSEALNKLYELNVL